MSKTESIHLADFTATEKYGEQLAQRLDKAALVFLHGQLGAGKTTLVRGILRALGHTATVKSPTYTLLEPYELAGWTVYHFDFYRINDPQELDFIGLDELLDAQAVKLIEWPERAQDRLPAPDVEILLSLEGEGRRIEITLPD